MSNIQASTQNINHQSAQTSLPYGYKIEYGSLYKVKITPTKNGDKETLTLVYKGKLEVLACEIDADTRNHKLVIQFQGNKGKLETVSVPLEEIATGRGVIANLAKRGAKIQEQQARLVSEYLIRFYEHNDDILATNSTTQFLGISGDGIITPLRSVGTDTKYTGALKLAVGNDKAAYPNAIKEIVSWGAPAWPLLFTLSMSLISPFLPRFQLRRNPIIAFLGQSNSGKTTAALFSNGVWGDSERSPFKVDGSGKTTSVGLEQNQLLLNGLPWLLDEIHKMRDFMIESAIYEWANKQTRVYGSPDGTPKGGTPLHGTLLLCGEDLPQLKNKGATNRLLMIDAASNPPLGVGGKIKNHDGQLVSNPEGAKRAKVLEDAWLHGMGLLGPDFSEYLLNDWDNFYSKYQYNLKNINDELEQWAATAAISTTTLEYLFAYLGVSVSDNDIIKLMPAKIAGLLHEYRNSDKDPDIAAWDSLQTMIGVASASQGGVWQLNNEVVWWHINRHDGTECYAIPTGTIAFQKYVGQHGKYSQSWLNQGLIIGTGKEKVTVTTSVPNPLNKKQRVKCLLIPVENLICHQSQRDGDKEGDKENDTQSTDNTNNIDNLSPMSPMSPSDMPHAHAHALQQPKIDGGIPLLPTLKNNGDNGDNGDNVREHEQKQTHNLSPTLSPIQNQAVVSGGLDDFQPNKTVMKNITLALEKLGSGNVFQIADGADGGKQIYINSLVQQHLDVMENVQCKQKDGQSIYSLI